jgi:rod shape determining protein RodA
LNNPKQKDIPTIGFDWPTIITYLVFVFAGLACIYSAIYSEAHTSLFDMEVSHGKQLMYIGVSVLLGFIILLSDYELYPTFAYILYGVIIALCILVIFVSPDIKGAHSWFQLGGFRFQPSEFGKFATALCLSRYLSGYDIKFQDRRTQVICAAIIGVPMIITLLQNDTGSALVYLSFILVLFREGLPGYWLVFGLIAVVSAILGLVVNIFTFLAVISIIATIILTMFFFIFRRQYTILYFTIAIWIISAVAAVGVNYVFEHVMQDHQRERINVLLGKEIDLVRAGYNVHQSKIAIGSGGFSGKGWLQGTQTKGNFVPEQSTDFIFCTVGEEWGFLGGLFIVGGFVWLLYRLVVIAERQRNKFNRVYAYSVTCILFFHFTINIGMTIGLLPVIGIPLPFFSYGGSSLLGFTILLFILLKLDSNRVNELQSVLD